MGFKDLASSMFSVRKSWGSLGTPLPLKQKRDPVRHDMKTRKNMPGIAKDGVGGGGEIEVVVTTQDAAAALKKAQATKADASGVAQKPPIGLSWHDQQNRVPWEGVRDINMGTVPSVTLDVDGEEDDRWLGDGVFSIDMHHRCRPFIARVEPLELMVQLDLVPQPAPAVGEEMAPGSSSPPGVGTSVDDTPLGFQNKQYNVWSNAAHGYNQQPAGIRAAEEPASGMQGVLVMPKGHK